MTTNDASRTAWQGSVRGLVEHAELACSFEHVLVAVATDDAIHQAALPGGQRDRAADQADADDGQCGDVHRAMLTRPRSPP